MNLVKDTFKIWHETAYKYAIFPPYFKLGCPNVYENKKEKTCFLSEGAHGKRQKHEEKITALGDGAEIRV